MLSMVAGARAEAQPPATRILLVRSDGALDPAALEALEARVRSNWAARGARVERPPAPRPDEPLGDVRERLDAIWSTYHALRLPEARDAVRALALELGRVQGAGADRPLLVELWLLTALAEEAAGDAERGAAALRRALAILPDLEVDPARYPPTLLEQVEALRAVEAPPGTLRISVAPPDAQVRVDGALTPERTVTVARGPHWVRAEAPHRVSAGTEVEVGEAPADVRLSLAIDPGGALAALGAPGRPLDARAREAVAALDAAASVLDVVADDGFRVTLTDEPSGRHAELHLERVVPARDAARLLDALLEETAEDPIWPWIVGAAVAVVAAAAVTTGVLLANQTDGWRAIGTR